MTKGQPVGRVSEVLRVTGAVVATLPVAVLTAVCLAIWLPGDLESRLRVGLTLALPLWVLGMCSAFLSRGGGRGFGAAWRAWR